MRCAHRTRWVVVLSVAGIGAIGAMGAVGWAYHTRHFALPATEIMEFLPDRDLNRDPLMTTDIDPRAGEFDANMHYNVDRRAEISIPGAASASEAVGVISPLSVPAPGGIGNKGQGGGIGEIGGYGLIREGGGYYGRSGSTRDGLRNNVARLAPIPKPAQPGPQPLPPPQPGFAPTGDADDYAVKDDSPFHRAAQTPLSTFSIDVDTASYSNARRYLLQEGRLPPRDAIRLEEMVNYFTYEDPPVAGDAPVAIKTEVGPCPWAPTHRLVRIGLKAKAVSAKDSPPRNLVFLVDTSGSMTPPDRLPLLVQGLKMLVKTLRQEDRVAIVAYAGSAGLVLPSTPGTQEAVILSALDQLHSGGSTNGGQGVVLAYKIARENFIKDGVNRVILGTDGDFNVGVTGRGDLVRMIEEQRKTDVFLSVLGFGHGNLKDATMETLAHHGNGHYAYIDSLEEARRIFVDQGAALQVVAGDVKVQVEFNPARVAGYRLVGYENRLMRDQDFNDDKKDAGDLGSGHTVTALYEIVPSGEKIPGVDPLRYQEASKLAPAANSKEMMNVKIRYKDPGAEKSKLIERPVLDVAPRFDETSTDFRFAAAVAEFAMILRESPHRGIGNFAGVVAQARDCLGQDPGGHRAEFVRMAEVARKLQK